VRRRARREALEREPASTGDELLLAAGGQEVHGEAIFRTNCHSSASGTVAIRSDLT
jgi:hypothetical protein